MGVIEGWRVVVHLHPGATVYVKVRNCRLQENSSPTARALLILQPGDAVVWKGTDASDGKWARVVRDGTPGVIFYESLSATKPNVSIQPTYRGGVNIDPQAFWSSGATKA